ncbi:ATP synthase subunit b' [Candidatus Trichorickettsia mobilis]|uniref:ATP synthase subunit b n=1 Tax=Candidatus Trichorickettsia mobilis TaxID=1346319 RepID=A0ABZ0UR79_9RICK|nr:hypothetical protein [Candidatus Trichorickettsia mobilis]WPY00321.1 ATP synthase subunit b' [Candidatus Trichorickettsia mobilis]
MPQFDISTYSSQIFWLAIIFSCLYLVISKIIAPTSEKILANRQQILDEYANSALTDAENVKRIQKNYDNSFKQILLATENIKQETLSAIDQLMIAQRATIDQDLAKQTALAKDEMDQIIASFESTKHDAIIELAGSILQKITQQPPNSQLLQECYKKIK